MILYKHRYCLIARFLSTYSSNLSWYDSCGNFALKECFYVKIGNRNQSLLHSSKKPWLLASDAALSSKKQKNIVLNNLFLYMKRSIGPKRDENGEWRRLHNEELHSLYRSPNIIRVIKSRRLRWAGKPTGKNLCGGLGVDERTILDCIY